MTDIKIDYNETPEIFFDGVRQKGLYFNEKQIWPKNVNTGNFEYAITFDPQGGNVETSFNSGWERTDCGKLTVLPNATHDTWTFLGWANKSFVTQSNISLNTVFFKDSIIYAIWEDNLSSSLPTDYIEISSTEEWFSNLNELGENNGDNVGFDLTFFPSLYTTASYDQYLVLSDASQNSLLLYDKENYFLDHNEGDNLWNVGNEWNGLKGYSKKGDNIWIFVPTIFDSFRAGERSWPIGDNIDSVWGEGESYDFYSHGSIYWNIIDNENSYIPQPIRLWVPYVNEDFLIPIDEEQTAFIASLGNSQNEKVILYAGRGIDTFYRLREVWPTSSNEEGYEGFIFEGFLISFDPINKNKTPEIIVNAVSKIMNFTENDLLMNIYQEGTLQ